MTTRNTSLQPYTAVATCPKCRHNKIGTIYHSGESCDAYGSDDICWEVQDFAGEKGTEHLNRYCKRCGYEWNEAVIA